MVLILQQLKQLNTPYQVHTIKICRLNPHSYFDFNTLFHVAINFQNKTNVFRSTYILLLCSLYPYTCSTNYHIDLAIGLVDLIPHITFRAKPHQNKNKHPHPPSKKKSIELKKKTKNKQTPPQKKTKSSKIYHSLMIYIKDNTGLSVDG